MLSLCVFTNRMPGHVYVDWKEDHWKTPGHLSNFKVRLVCIFFVFKGTVPRDGRCVYKWTVPLSTCTTLKDTPPKGLDFYLQASYFLHYLHFLRNRQVRVLV